MLHVITMNDYLKDKWYNFGYHLKLNIGKLNEIEMSSTSTIQCTRKVVLHWRSVNKTKSYEPLAAALAKVDLSWLAHRLQDYFSTKHESPTGVYCSLCKIYHPELENTPQAVPGMLYSRYTSKKPLFIIITLEFISLMEPPSEQDFIKFVAEKIQDKYKLFGIAVGLDNSYLQSLRVDYHTCMERFIEVFCRWKNSKADNITWTTVIEALRSGTVEAPEVAESLIFELKKRNC